MKMENRINAYFDTGFLSPYLNFALFCASFILAVFGLILGAYL